MGHKKYYILYILIVKACLLFGASKQNYNDAQSFFVIDTLYECNYKVYRKYIQNEFGSYFISLKDKNTISLLGIPLLNNIEMIDYKNYCNIFGLKEYYYEYPIDSKNHNGLQEVYFVKKPKCFFVCLIKGLYYNKVSHWLDGPSEYPFKDENAYYVVYVPIWEDVQ